MSRTLKWVLAILGVIVVVAAIGGAVWFVQSRAQMMASYRAAPAQPGVQVTPGAPNSANPPVGPRGFNNNNRGKNWQFRGPMMGGGRPFRFGRFGMGFMLLRAFFRLIIPLALLVLVAFIFYQLGRRASRPVVSGPPPSDNNAATKS